MTDYRGPHMAAAADVGAGARPDRSGIKSGSQREPENVVSVVDGDPAADGAVLLTKMSLDSIDTAAMYLINVIDRLQEDPHEP